MEKIMKFITILCLLSIMNAVDKFANISINEPLVYQNEEYGDLTCVGNDPPE